MDLYIHSVSIVLLTVCACILFLSLPSQRLRMSYWMDIVNATVATGVLPKTTALALDF